MNRIGIYHIAIACTSLNHGLRLCLAVQTMNIRTVYTYYGLQRHTRDSGWVQAARRIENNNEIILVSITVSYFRV